MSIPPANNRFSPAYLWMLAGSFLLAWMGQFAHLLKDQCDWRITAVMRSGLAFGFSLTMARICRAELVLWHPRALWLRGCASSLSLLCTFFALAQLPTAEVIALANTVPIWVAFLSWPLLGERPGGSVWAAAACGVCGVALIQSPHFESRGGAALAAVLALTAAFTSAIAMLGLHRLRGLNPWAVVVHYSGVATVFVLASWLAGPAPDLAPVANCNTVLLLVGVGGCATAGQFCVTRAFTGGPPAGVAVVGLTQIIFALGLDLLFDSACVHSMMLLGIALVLLPTAWVMVGRRT